MIHEHFYIRRQRIPTKTEVVVEKIWRGIGVACSAITIFFVMPVVASWVFVGLLDWGWWGFGMVVITILGLIEYNKEKNE